MSNTCQKFKTALKHFTILLMAALLFTGCVKHSDYNGTAAGSNADQTDDTTAKPTAKLSRFKADYDLLWDILESDYPYLPYLREKGIDVDGIRESYEKQLKDVVDAKAFAAIVRKVFAGLKNTAHLSLLEPEMFKDMYSFFVLSPEMEDNVVFEPWREVLVQAAEAGYYSAPKTYSGNSSAYGRLPDAAVTYYEECKTLYFSIPTFYTTTVERDRDLFEIAAADYPDAENIVIDITKNDGGDDMYWRENIVAPFGEGYTFCWRDFYRSTPFNDRTVDKLGKNRSVSETDSVPEWALKMGLDRYLINEITITGRDAIHSDAKRWVLVDDTVFSSSEMFVNFCKSTGWATVAGTQTSGDGLCFEPVLRLLPDSGLVIRFSMAAGENEDGTMNIEGTVPDMLMEKADIAHMLDLIRAGNEN